MYLVECFTDENVLRGCGILGSDIRRTYGKGNIMRIIRNKMKGPAVAIADLDRMQPQPKEFGAFKRVSSDHGLDLREWNGHRLILVDDNIEDWLIRAMHRTSMRMEQFGLPDDPDALHAIEPRVGDDRFARAVRALMDAGSPDLLKLREYLGVKS